MVGWRPGCWIAAPTPGPHARWQRQSDLLGTSRTVRQPTNRGCPRGGRDAARGRRGRTARWAVVVGDGNWLRARHAEGALSINGPAEYAVRRTVSRCCACCWISDSTRTKPAGWVGSTRSSSHRREPLRTCARLAARHGGVLLQRRESEHARVRGELALSHAHERRDDPMIALLERHGARLDPVSAGALGLADHAARLLADAAAGKVSDASESFESNVAQGLMWGAIERPSPEIVRMALAHVDWPREDARWYSILQNGLYPGAAGIGPPTSKRFVWCSTGRTQTRGASTARRCCTTSRPRMAAGRRSIGWHSPRFCRRRRASRPSRRPAEKYTPWVGLSLGARRASPIVPGTGSRSD